MHEKKTFVASVIDRPQHWFDGCESSFRLLPELIFAIAPEDHWNYI